MVPNEPEILAPKPGKPVKTSKPKPKAKPKAKKKR